MINFYIFPTPNVKYQGNLYIQNKFNFIDLTKYNVDFLSWYFGNEHHLTINSNVKLYEEILKNEDINYNLLPYKNVYIDGNIMTIYDNIDNNDLYIYDDIEGTHIEGNLTSFYGEKLEKPKGFICNKNGIDIYTLYHKMYIGTHLCSTIKNLKGEGKNILIIGDSMGSMIVPLIIQKNKCVTYADIRNVVLKKSTLSNNFFEKDYDSIFVITNVNGINELIKYCYILGV